MDWFKKFSNQVFHNSRWKLEWKSTNFHFLGVEFSVESGKIPELNYNNQIPKIISLIQQWKRRILTPIGRTTIVKTIIIPKLNHLFISLPNPSKDLLPSLCRDIFVFIWKSKYKKVR